MPVDLISHYNLCKATAQRFFKSADVVLWEYQTMIAGEHPDVIVYKGNRTAVYEIKVSRSDFLREKKKSCRKKYKTKTNWFNKKPQVEIVLIEKPHLGSKRFYVCPAGMIQPEEVGNWGLIWYKPNKCKCFFIKKNSKTFRRNIFAELSLITHAFRKRCGLGEDCNVFVNSFHPE